MCSLLKPSNLRDTARQRERAQTISANTNMGNGSKMEFTRACFQAGAAKKTVSLNQADLNGNREEEANSCFSQQALRNPAATGRKAPH